MIRVYYANSMNLSNFYSLFSLDFRYVGKMFTCLFDCDVFRGFFVDGIRLLGVVHEKCGCTITSL